MFTVKKTRTNVNCIPVGRITRSTNWRVMSTTCLLLLLARQATGICVGCRSPVLQFVNNFSVRRIQLEMLGQAKISSFFTTSASKRCQDDSKIEDVQVTIISLSFYLWPQAQALSVSLVKPLTQPPHTHTGHCRRQSSLATLQPPSNSWHDKSLLS